MVNLSESASNKLSDHGGSTFQDCLVCRDHGLSLSVRQRSGPAVPAAIRTFSCIISHFACSDAGCAVLMEIAARCSSDPWQQVFKVFLVKLNSSLLPEHVDLAVKKPRLFLGGCQNCLICIFSCRLCITRLRVSTGGQHRQQQHFAMMASSLCSSSQGELHTVFDVDQHYQHTAATLRQIVSGALSLSSSGALSISSAGPAARSCNETLTSQRAPAAALQHMMPKLPLLAAQQDQQTAAPPQQHTDCPPCSPCSPPGGSWQAAWRAAAGQQAQDKGALCPSSNSSRPSARRCLCLSLQTEDLAPVQDTAALPHAPFTPSIGPEAPAAVTPAAAGPAVPETPSSCMSCSHSSSSKQSRLQQWLGTMELRLQVPPTPLVPPVEPCPAPKGPSSCMEALERRKRTLAAVSSLSLSSPAASDEEQQERCCKRRSSSDGAAAATVVAPAAHIAAVLAPVGAAAAPAPPQQLLPEAIPDVQAQQGETIEQQVEPASWLESCMPPPAFVILGVLSSGNSSK